LDSPVLLNIFTRIVRRTKDGDHPAPLITLTEMFPSHEELWLPDAEGRRYTSELRMVALDISAPEQTECLRTDSARNARFSSGAD